jgi:hypothetical protein
VTQDQRLERRQLRLPPALRAPRFSSTRIPGSSQFTSRPPPPRWRGNAIAGCGEVVQDARRDEARSIAEVQTEYATEPRPGRPRRHGRQVNVCSCQWVPVKQLIRVVPRRDLAAMVTADAERPEGVWLPGDVQLYRDGAYIGSTYWQAQQKDRLVLPFGRDDRVQVTVNRLKNRTGSGGFVGTKAERQIADQYTIVSRHKSPVELLLLEPSPVAVNDRTMSTRRSSPSRRPTTGKTGAAWWRGSGRSPPARC